ncbi:MAG: complex I NDUFA9 subunit family protein [Thermodesulfobacteriota bacterium]|nr:complex I NDUFA9 subunit family protein [Thermodesulfobacteriota bacterium]
MVVFITGSTGFVGNRVLSVLKEEGYWIKALVRKGSECKLQNSREVEIVNGDITQPGSIKGNLKGCDAVIHLVGIIREIPGKGVTFQKVHCEGTKNIVNAAAEEGVKRFIHMSALGVKPHARTKYHKTKYFAEEHVINSGLNYTIFRPSFIFGPGDEFINVLAKNIRRLPLFPIIGNGNYKIQPIALEDISTAFTSSLSLNHTKGKIYEVGGVEKLRYMELVQIISEVMGKRLRKIHLPIWLVKRMTALMSGIPYFPITYDQLKMLLEDNICDERTFLKDFDISPTLFRKGIARYLT